MVELGIEQLNRVFADLTDASSRPPEGVLLLFIEEPLRVELDSNICSDLIAELLVVSPNRRPGRPFARPFDALLELRDLVR